MRLCILPEFIPKIPVKEPYRRQSQTKVQTYEDFRLLIGEYIYFTTTEEF